MLEEINERLKDLIDDATDIISNANHEAFGSYVDAERFFGWKASCEATIRSVPTDTKSYLSIFEKQVKTTMLSDIQTGLGVLKSLQKDIEKGYLRTVEDRIISNTYADLLSTAIDFLNQGYKDPAGVLAGVALEDSLRRIGKEKVEGYKDTFSFGKINASLSKLGIYNDAKRNELDGWYKIRDLANHAKWEDFDKEQVKGMIECTNKLIADYL